MKICANIYTAPLAWADWSWLPLLARVWLNARWSPVGETRKTDCKGSGATQTAPLASDNFCFYSVLACWPWSGVSWPNSGLATVGSLCGGLRTAYDSWSARNVGNLLHDWGVRGAPPGGSEEVGAFAGAGRLMGGACGLIIELGHLGHPPSGFTLG